MVLGEVAGHHDPVRFTFWQVLTVGVACLAMAVTIYPLMHLGSEFMPPLDEGSLAINVVRLPNASLEGSVRVAEFLEKRLLAFPEVATVVSKTAAADAIRNLRDLLKKLDEGSNAAALVRTLPTQGYILDFTASEIRLVD